jgi:hypothetical protein
VSQREVAREGTTKERRVLTSRAVLQKQVIVR